ncbi:MAG: Rpn family recombination-promoting nuclease/putative transposase [Bryobacteraceae bacterium]
MYEYDAALKLLLQASSGSVLRQAVGHVEVTHWLDAEFKQVQIRHADLLGATAGGQLVHIELQSTNDEDMPLRMIEYAIGIYRQFRQLPIQIVLYVGEAPLRMAAALHGPDPVDPDFAFRFTLTDFRDLDGKALLNSDRIEDNVLAILARLQSRIEAVRHILERITVLNEPARSAILARFLVISGLRRLAPTVQQEAQKMPILNDILSHEVIGPAILQGRQEGLQEGLQEGRQEGQREILRRQMEKRFGAIPNWVEGRLASFSESELDEFAMRLLDASRLEELFAN